MKLSLPKKVGLAALLIYSAGLIGAALPRIFTPPPLMPFKRSLERFFNHTLGIPPGIPVFSFGTEKLKTYVLSFCAVNYGITAQGRITEDRSDYSERCPRTPGFYALTDDHRAIFFYHLAMTVRQRSDANRSFRFVRLRSTQDNFRKQALQSLAFLSCRKHPEFTSVITGIRQTSWLIEEKREVRHWVNLAKWSCRDLSLSQIETGPRAEDDPHLQQLWPEVLKK